MSVDYNFPSNFRAPKGFKSYRTKGGYALKKEGDTDSPLRVSEKKQVEAGGWIDGLFTTAFIFVMFGFVCTVILLARMYLYSL